MNNGLPTTSFVFVSYDRDDADRVEPLVNFLYDNGIPVWWDKNIEPGSPFRQAIEEHLSQSTCIIVVWTQTSVASTFVHAEADTGFQRGVLIPIKLDTDAHVPLPFNELHHLDLSKWAGNDIPELQQLLSRIHSLSKEPPTKNYYYTPLSENDWAINDSQNATTELRNLTSNFKSIGEILITDSEATQYLNATLEEIGKTYDVVNEAIRDFITPAIGAGAMDATPFLDMERGSLMKKINDGRGHCTRILSYYGRYKGLRDSIKNKLTPEKLNEVDEIFSRLSTADGDLFEQLVRIGQVLTDESRVIVNLLMAGQEDVAKKRIIAGREKLEPLEAQLATAMSDLQRLQRSLGYTESRV